MSRPGDVLCGVVPAGTVLTYDNHFFCKPNRPFGFIPSLDLTGPGTAYPQSISARNHFKLAWKYQALRIEWNFSFTRPGKDEDGEDASEIETLTGAADLLAAQSDFRNLYNLFSFDTDEGEDDHSLYRFSIGDVSAYEGVPYPSFSFRLESKATGNFAGNIWDKDPGTPGDTLYTYPSGVSCFFLDMEIPIYHRYEDVILSGTISIEPKLFRACEDGDGTPIFNLHTGEQLILPTPSNFSVG